MRTFLDDDDRHFFLEKLGEIVQAGWLMIHAFCLMSNHYHLLAETPLGQLSRWMQRLLGEYAQRFNRRHHRVGHLFQGRYKALLVEDGEYFLECSRYIHLNPQRAWMTQPAELYRWSSYRNFVGGPCVVDWVRTDRTLLGFADVGDYREFVEAGRDKVSISPFERAKAGLALGSEAFVESIARRLRSSSHRNAPATARALTRKPVSGSSIEGMRQAVDRLFQDWSACQRRRVLMSALRSLALQSTQEIADQLGVTAGAVSKAQRAIRARSVHDPELSRRLDCLIRDVSAGSTQT